MVPDHRDSGLFELPWTVLEATRVHGTPVRRSLGCPIDQLRLRRPECAFPRPACVATQPAKTAAHHRRAAPGSTVGSIVWPYPARAYALALAYGERLWFPARL